jgi:putative acetyltransferase
LFIFEGGLDDLAVQKLLRVHLQAAHDNSPPGSVHALDTTELIDPDIRFWSVWDSPQKQNLLGFGALKSLSPGHTEIKSMHTDARSRGQGVAGTLLRHLIEQARVGGATRLSLETGCNAPYAAARHLYARHGFTRCAPFAHYVDDGFSLCLSREI